jgi:hypothetical protein
MRGDLPSHHAPLRVVGGEELFAMAGCLKIESRRA